eukprot:g11993.t1
MQLGAQQPPPRLPLRKVLQRGSFTLSLGNVVTGRVIEVKVPSRSSAPPTVERLKRLVARQWKRLEGLQHCPWQWIEILVTEAEKKRLLDEAGLLAHSDPVVESGSPGKDCGNAEKSSTGQAETEELRSSVDSEEELLQPLNLVPLEPSTLEFDAKKFQSQLTGARDVRGSSEGLDGVVQMQFFVRGPFAGFESRSELSAALRTMQAADHVAREIRNALPKNVVFCTRPDSFAFSDYWFFNHPHHLPLVAHEASTLLERDPEPFATHLGLREYPITEINHGHGGVLEVTLEFGVRWILSRFPELLVTSDEFPRVLAGKRAVEETYGPFATWDLSGVNDLSFLFAGRGDFCADISGWNVRGVRSMRGMFANCSHFNSNLADWDVSTVQDFEFMFYKCTDFDQPLGPWRVKKNASLAAMFEDCSSLSRTSVATLKAWDMELWSEWQMEGMLSGCDLVPSRDSLPRCLDREYGSVSDKYDYTLRDGCGRRKTSSSFRRKKVQRKGFRNK